MKCVDRSIWGRRGIFDNNNNNNDNTSGLTFDAIAKLIHEQQQQFQNQNNHQATQNSDEETNNEREKREQQQQNKNKAFTTPLGFTPTLIDIRTQLEGLIQKGYVKKVFMNDEENENNGPARYFFE